MTRRGWSLGMAAGGLSACRSRSAAALPPRGTDDGTGKRYRLEGEVIRLDRDAKTATIRHGPVTDDAGRVWMEAMTMDFPVPRDSDRALLRAGAMIRAVVVSRESDYEYWIEKVELLP